jgi:copper chaperone CopZ
MKTRSVVLIAGATLASLAVIFSGPVGAQQSKDILTAGTYTAKVKAIVCSGCPALIKQALEKMKEIDSVSVDSQKRTVQFTVKKSTTVKLSDLQKALKVAADRMGMGADYTLLDLKPLK